MKHKGKCQNAIWYLAFSRSFTSFEDTFAVFPLAFSILAKEQMAYKHNITVH